MLRSCRTAAARQRAGSGSGCSCRWPSSSSGARGTRAGRSRLCPTARSKPTCATASSRRCRWATDRHRQAARRRGRQDADGRDAGRAGAGRAPVALRRALLAACTSPTGSASCSAGSRPSSSSWASGYFMASRRRGPGRRRACWASARARPRSTWRRTTGVTLRRRRRRRRGQGRAAGDRRFPEEPEGARPARRAHAQGRAADRARRAPARRCSRARCAGEAGVPVLLDQRLGVRRDVRRRRRGARARPVRAGARQRAGDHLHRRARRAGQDARRLVSVGGHDETRADAEPAAGRARRLRSQRRRGAARGDQPARRSSTRRCCARAASTARCWSTGPTGGGRLAILRVHAKKIRLADGADLEQVAAITVGLRRRATWPTSSTKRRWWRRGGRADAVTLADFTRGDRAHRRRHREEASPARAAGDAARGLSRAGACADGAGAARRRPRPQGVDRAARHRRARLHACSGRARTATCCGAAS